MASNNYEPKDIEESETLLNESHTSPGRRSSWRTWKCPFWLVMVAAALCLPLLGLIVILGVASLISGQWRAPATYELAGDVNGIAPRFSQQIRTFMPDNRYVGNLTSPSFKEKTQDLWLSLVPKGLGFVDIPSPEQYKFLSTPYIKYNKTVYTTSVTHQLHCLFMIMHGMNELAVHGTLNMGGDEGLTREGEDPTAHLSHCFDYLRQAIMCHGDTALEGLQTTFGPDVGGSDGWNAVHVCKRYDEVYKWLENKRIDDREWI